MQECMQMLAISWGVGYYFKNIFQTVLRRVTCFSRNSGPAEYAETRYSGEW
jgi:hypothetical protein